MAKQPKSKHRPYRLAAFYEAIPLALPTSTTLPHVASHLEESAVVWHDIWKNRLHQLRSLNIATIRQAIHRTPSRNRYLKLRAYPLAIRFMRFTKRSIQTAGLAMANWLVEALRHLRIAWVYTWNRLMVYAPPLAQDAAASAKSGVRALTSKRARIAYIVLIGLISASGATVLGIMATKTLAAYANELSSPAALIAKKRTGTTILDRNGVVLYEGYGAQSEGSVKLDDIPKSLRDATIAAEDPSFYDHAGFSWQGTIRAAWVDITHGVSALEGGSTLTQQLVKNALLTHDKNITRKLQELLLSTNIEQRYSKDQILEMYLNGIYYGQGASGVEAAAQTYFRKPVRDLTLSESALIAGLPLGPNRFDPNYDLEAATGRRNFVLSRMQNLGKITKAQADQAKSQPLVLAGSATAAAGTNAIIVHARDISIRAPHFVFYILKQLREMYGEELIEQGGITVRTTLDFGKQQIAERTVAQRINELADHHVTNGGLVSLEPATGDILAMVGSVDYNAPGFGNVNVTLSQLQPGSSFKPIAYATAFKKGWTGATRVEDTPMYIPQSDGTMYIPQNYDLKFHGTVTLRRALDNSFNIPAIKVLQFAGIHDTIATAHDLGITSLQDESRFGLALVLGGGEVSPLDMATAYATFANSGVRVTPRAVLSVKDRLGRDITKPQTTTPTTALDPRIAYMITHILSDDASRTPEFPLNSPLKLSRPAAAKTGTTNDFRDNWTVGYTPGLSTAVWVGNNDHSPMENIDGITGAAPIWHDYMEAALAGTPVQQFPVPTGVTIASICPDGSLADGFTTGLTEVFLSEAMPTNRCRMHTPAPTPTIDTPAPSPADLTQGAIDNIRHFFSQNGNGEEARNLRPDRIY